MINIPEKYKYTLFTGLDFPITKAEKITKILSYGYVNLCHSW